MITINKSEPNNVLGRLSHCTNKDLGSVTVKAVKYIS